MTNPTNKQKLIAKIFQNVHSKKWGCIIDCCNEHAINSHLIQQNGILDNISINGHIIEYKLTNPFAWNANSPHFNMTLIGIKKAFSHPVFCNTHDNKIFKDIETHPIDLSSHKAHLLLSYRVICTGIRKKEKNAELFKRILNAETFKGENLSEIKMANKVNENSILLYKKYKKLIEKELKFESQDFTFRIYKYPILEILGSAVFSPNENIQTNQTESTNPIFIHIIPYNNELNVIIGYNNKNINEKIIKYVDSWKNLDVSSFQQKLTYLFCVYIENWGMSPNLYNNIKKNNLEQFKKIILNRANNYIPIHLGNFNLFELDDSI